VLRFFARLAVSALQIMYYLVWVLEYEFGGLRYEKLTFLSENFRGIFNVLYIDGKRRVRATNWHSF
jgi:hypothetical protein